MYYERSPVHSQSLLLNEFQVNHHVSLFIYRHSVVYHFSSTTPTDYRPNHKGNICASKDCAITTHSSDACLHKQRLCTYRKEVGCDRGGLDM